MLKRRGRPHHFRATIPVLTIIAFMAIVSVIGYKTRVADVFGQEAIASEKLYAYANYHATNLADENQQLKDKLDRSAKIATTDTQKAITRFYIAKYFGSEAPIAEKVFTCESNLNPMALNDKNVGGSVDRGVAQINSSNRKTFEKVTGLNYDIYAHDTESNIKYAKWLLDNSQGHWHNWVCAKIVNI